MIENKWIRKIGVLSKRRILVEKGDFISKKESLKDKKREKSRDILTEMRGKVVEK